MRVNVDEIEFASDPVTFVTSFKVYNPWTDDGLERPLLTSSSLTMLSVSSTPAPITLPATRDAVLPQAEQVQEVRTSMALSTKC